MDNHGEAKSLSEAKNHDSDSCQIMAIAKSFIIGSPGF